MCLDFVINMNYFCRRRSGAFIHDTRGYTPEKGQFCRYSTDKHSQALLEGNKPRGFQLVLSFYAFVTQQNNEYLSNEMDLKGL